MRPLLILILAVACLVLSPNFALAEGHENVDTGYNVNIDLKGDAVDAWAEKASSTNASHHSTTNPPNRRGNGKARPVADNRPGDPGKPPPRTRIQRGYSIDKCGQELSGAPIFCEFEDPEPEPSQDPAPQPPRQPARPDPVTIAQHVTARLEIPAPIAHTGPDHTNNEWNMLAVGFPVWLWTTGPDVHTTTVTEQGLTMTLTARRVTTEFDLGDGTNKFCGYTTAYWQGTPGHRSPSCDHIYQEPSTPGSYPITATTHWQVTWSAVGQTGTLPFHRTGPPSYLPVGELVSVRVPNRPGG